MTDAAPIPLLLVDDHQLVLEGLSRALQASPGFTVVGTATSTDDARQKAAELRPKVVLMDICMPGRGAFETAREILALGGGVRVILLTGFLADVFISQALKLRLSGYILKEESIEFLIAGIKKVAAGETVYSAQVEQRLVFDSTTHRFVAKCESDLSALTSRQVEVLRHLACGQSVKEIATMMQLSQKSVDSHKYRIMNKLGIHDRVELARFAIREGLMVP
jgi:DNA-binding NarL/FixJ family response regulator